MLSALSLMYWSKRNWMFTEEQKPYNVNQRLDIFNIAFLLKKTRTIDGKPVRGLNRFNINFHLCQEEQISAGIMASLTLGVVTVLCPWARHLFNPGRQHIVLIWLKSCWLGRKASKQTKPILASTPNLFNPFLSTFFFLYLATREAIHSRIAVYHKTPSIL